MGEYYFMLLQIFKVVLNGRVMQIKDLGKCVRIKRLLFQTKINLKSNTQCSMILLGDLKKEI